MTHLFYAVYDSKVEKFMAPFMLRTKGEAIRGWKEAANDPKTMFCRHPGDFTLFELATYNEDTGTFENHKTPISLGTALEFKDSVPDNIIQGIKEKI